MALSRHLVSLFKKKLVKQKLKKVTHSGCRFSPDFMYKYIGGRFNSLRGLDLVDHILWVDMLVVGPLMMLAWVVGLILGSTCP